MADYESDGYSDDEKITDGVDQADLQSFIMNSPTSEDNNDNGRSLLGVAGAELSAIRTENLLPNECKGFFFKSDNTFVPFKESNNDFSPYEENSRDEIYLAEILEEIKTSKFSSFLKELLSEKVLRDYAANPFRLARPWSDQFIPWIAERIERDSSRFQSNGDDERALEVLKIVLRTAILDFHEQSKTLYEFLMKCARVTWKLGEFERTMRFTSEALHFDRKTDEHLQLRSRAFEKLQRNDLMEIDVQRFRQANASCTKPVFYWTTFRSEETNRQEEIEVTDDRSFLSFYEQMKIDSPTKTLEAMGDETFDDCCFISAIELYAESLRTEGETTDIYRKLGECFRKLHEPLRSIEFCDKSLALEPNKIETIYCKALAFKELDQHENYQKLLIKCLEIEPNNQILLNELYSLKCRSIPRTKRRIRSPVKVIETFVFPEPANPISYHQLEDIRYRSYAQDSDIESIVNSPFENQCAFVLDLPETDLLRVIHSASSSLIKLFVDVFEVFIFSEEQAQRDQTQHIYFSYQDFTFRLLLGLTNLPSIDDALQQIDEEYRIKLNRIIAFFSFTDRPKKQIQRLQLLKK